MRSKLNRPGRAVLLGTMGMLVVTGAAAAQDGPLQTPPRDEGQNETTTLEDIIVTGARQARRDALDQERASINLREVATADDIGKLPDDNLADALSRLPGVSVQQSRGEGRFVSIRGISPDLNLVTVNGQPTAVPDVDGRAGRAGPLDVIGAGDFATVEVIKTLRPDLDAQGIGGVVNVTTPSALSQPGRFGYARADAGRNDQETDADIFAVSGGYGTRYLDGALGVFLGGSYSADESHIEQVNGQNWLPAANGGLAPQRLQLDEILLSRERYALNSNVEFRSNDALTEAFVRFSYSDFEDDEDRPEAELRLRSPLIFTSETTATSSSASVDLETRREITQRQILNVSAGGERRFGADAEFLLEGQLTFSAASEENPRLNYYEFNLTGRLPATLDIGEQLFIIDLGPGRLDPANYTLQQIRYEQSIQEEEIYIPSLDLTWDRSLFGGPGSVKIGGKATLRDRFINDTSTRFAASGAPLNFAPFAVAGPTDFRDRYVFGPRADTAALDRFFAENPGRFQLNEESSTINSAEDDYDIAERVYAAYVLTTVEFGDLTLLGGVRVEHTTVDISANQAVFIDGDFQGLERRDGQSEFTNVFPSIQARYALAENLVFRAAYTTSIGRPDFVDLAPISTLDIEETSPGVFDGSLEEGNPELEPFLAQNFDLALEWYFDEGAVLSAGVFHKRIDNPIFQFSETLRNVSRQGRQFEELDLRQTRNAEEATISGVELAYQQQFDFLPGALRGLGVSLNATLLESEVIVPGRDDELPFFNQPDAVYNAQLFYELGRVEARVAWRSTSEKLVSPVAPGVDIFEGTNEQVDASLSYGLTPSVFLFAEGRNLTDEPFYEYQGQPSNLITSEIFGRTVRVGISAKF